VLCRRWDYKQVNQEGSHIILQTETPGHHRLSVPDHKPLRLGTLNAILRSVAVAKGVSREDLIASL
jgi:predicted RNA binding protein YcfA (HicA-like mRNA interferase family)